MIENNIDHKLIEAQGLSSKQIIETDGSIGANRLSSTIDLLVGDNITIENKIAMSKAIINWQSLTNSSLRRTAFEASYLQIINVIKTILLQLDDSIIINEYNLKGNQMIGLYMSQSLSKEVSDQDDAFGDLIYKQLIITIQEILDKNILVQEATSFGQATPSSVRAETVLHLVKCFPQKVNDAIDLKLTVSIFIGILSRAIEAPILRQEVSKKLSTIGIEDNQDDATFQNLWGDKISDTLNAIKNGHTEFTRILRKNKLLFSAKSDSIEHHLSDMIESLGFDELEELIHEISELHPAKLLKSIPTFLDQLTKAVMKHKFLILGVFLTIALVLGAAYILPSLSVIGIVCMVVPDLFIPFFKLLTALAVPGEIAAVQCLTFIAKIARSGLCQTVALQHALLEAVNIIKDYMAHSNVFSPETIAALAAISASNVLAFENIKKWNEGKSAQRGDGKKYLTDAGKVPPPFASTFAGKIINVFSPVKAKSVGVNSNIVSPSPHSQNLSLLETNSTAINSSNTPALANPQRNLFPEEKETVSTTSFTDFVAKQRADGITADNHILDPSTIRFNIDTANTTDNKQEIRDPLAAATTTTTNISNLDNSANKNSSMFSMFGFGSSATKPNAVVPLKTTTVKVDAKKVRDETISQELSDLRNKVELLDISLNK